MSLSICPNPQTPRMNSKVNYGLRVTVMCQCRFIDCNMYHSGGDVDTGEGHAYVGVEGL